MKSAKVKVKSPLLNTQLFDRNLGDYAKRDEFQSIRRQIARLGSLYDGLNAVRETPDPFKTAAQIEVDYGRKFTEAQALAKNSAEYVMKITDDLAERAHQSMLVKTKLDRPVANASEIRSYIRSMDDQQRREFVANAVDNGRHEVITAISDSIPELSGLTSEQVSSFQNMYIETHAPEYKQEMEAIDKALELFELAGDSFMQSADKMRDPHKEVEAEKMKQQADAADAALKQALSGE